MALPISSMYNDIIKGPHEQVTRIRVFHGPTEVTPAGGVPIIDGSVSASLSSRVSRTLDLAVPFEFYPHNPTDLLSPYRATVQVESGPRYLDGTSELFPLFTGRIYEATLAGDGTVSLRADDLAADVLAFRFEQPQNSQPFTSIVQQIQALISEAVNGATFGPNDVDDTVCPTITWDEDRGQALDDLAAALKARWYALGDGRFVIREYPYLTSTPVAFLVDGTASDRQGLIISASKTITRDSTANSVTVVSERMDGTTPVVARRRDASSSSPTQFGGLFGKVSQIIKVQTPLTAVEADALARRQLASSLALTEQWQLETPLIHFLEPGDTIRIRYREIETVQVIDSWNIPLTTNGTMSFVTRSSVPEPVSES